MVLAEPSVSPILASSLEVMEHAIEHLKIGTDRDLKFAVQHADNAVELMLKELARFKRIRLIDKRGQSLSYYDCINKLEEKGVKIPELTDIDLLHTERNSIYHLGSQPDKRKTEWLVYDVGLNLIKRICKEELRFDITKSSKLFKIPSKIEQEIESTKSEMVNMYLFETISSFNSNVYSATVVSAFSGIEALLRETFSYEIRSQRDLMKKLFSQKMFSNKLTRDINTLRQIRNKVINGVQKATNEQATFALNVLRKAIDEVNARAQKDKAETAVSSERETQKESLLPVSAKITELNIDDKMLDQIHAEAHRKALNIYEDAQLSNFTIQVIPFDKSGRPRVNIYMEFYAKWADRTCRFQYSDIDHELKHSTPDKRPIVNYNREVFTTLPWKTHPNWRQFLRRAYDKIKPLPKDEKTCYHLSAHAYRGVYWTVVFEDGFTGNEYPIEWIGRGLDENSIKQIR